MNVSLTAELEAFVERAVASGRFGTASEAVRAGLRLLEEREAKFEALKRDIQKGLDSGVGGVMDEAFIERIKRQGRERLAARRAAE